MNRKEFNDSINTFSSLAKENFTIPPELFVEHDVKKGLRNSNGTGVLVGLTEIGDVVGYELQNGKKVAVPGQLKYRGIDIDDIVNGFLTEGRLGYEEVCFLLLFGQLPDAATLAQFNRMLGSCRSLPEGFTRDMILKAPSMDVMNKLARSVLAFYSYDKNPDDLSAENVLRQSIELISRFPAMTAYGYQATSYYHGGRSLFLHKPDPSLSTAENFLMMLRPDGQFTPTEAATLDLSLVLHADHGGGNNSAFTVRVVSSTGTDTYSAIAAAIGSLKGPKHGGANIKVIEMMEDLKEHITNWNDDEEITQYLRRIASKEAFDRTGLIYGVGHAIYTLSDPRAVLLKKMAHKLAEEKGRMDEFNLFCKVEELAPLEVQRAKKSEKPFCINVDFYSGFIYRLLNIPIEVSTPLFAISRVTSWCAHRIEELLTVNQIIRPAFKCVQSPRAYIPLKDRFSLNLPGLSANELSGEDDELCEDEEDGRAKTISSY